MFRPKDKYGFFIYTCTKPLNGKEYAMLEDRQRNKGHSEIFNYWDSDDFYMIENFATTRLSRYSFYTNAYKWEIPTRAYSYCDELRYCYVIGSYILVIRKKPITFNGKLKREKFRGFYFIKRMGDM